MFRSIRVAAGKDPLTVYGVYARAAAPPRLGDLAPPAREAIRRAMKRPEFQGEVGETVDAGEGRLLFGLGEKAKLDTRVLRTAGAQLARQLDRRRARAARLMLAASIPGRVGDARTAGRCIAEGMGIGNWRVDFFAGTASKTSPPRPPLAVTGEPAAFRAGLREGLTLAECTNEARRIAATPPNLCHPAWIAAEAKRLARRSGLTCRVIGWTEAQRLGMGVLVAVGRGSHRKPCLILLEHRPPRAAKGTKLALVGKTMTFDTGGYSMKPAAGMKGMKYDANGGCAVLGAMLAIAALKVPVHVVALLPAAENMVAGDAYRPDDIITMYNGVTVEVTNTDAEGRLVLGDALAYASRRLKPTAVIDVATLTGGVVVALGGWCAGLFCNDERLRRRVEDASATTGERVWPLPLWEEHRDFMRSNHADIWNSGPKRDGHPIQGAAFLSYFVDPGGPPWAHLDIAGVSAVDGDSAMHVTGPTGFGVRLLTEVARSFAAERTKGQRD